MLSDAYRNKLINALILDEGFRSQPYDDATSEKLTAQKGKVTLGCGRNLDDCPLTIDEAIYLMKRPLDELEHQLDNTSFYKTLSDERKLIILNMAYNLGYNGLLQFKRMIAAIETFNYKLVAEEMLNSKWAQQVGDRAVRLAKEMEA